MSWTLGNKKWTIPFTSFEDVACHIDIYQRGYTSNVVTELSTDTGTPGIPATDPIYWEEDDDEDLLKVVRAKTGYINLVETVYGGLSELFPTKNTDLYVEFYYGQTLSFIGFVQAQSFENPWKSAPREISIPIISPLGLLESITMPVYNPPQAISLAALLDDVLDLYAAIGIQYTGVTWPKLSIGLSATLSSLVTSPFNSDFSPALRSDTDLFDPISALDFIEGLCNCFGWMVHEAATELVFSMFDHGGQYNYVTAANLRTLTSVQVLWATGNSVEPLTYYATPSDGEGKESGIMPVDKVVLEYEGGWVESCKFDFDHLEYNSDTSYGNMVAAWLLSNTPELTGGDSPLLINNYIVNGRLSMAGVNPCSCGNIREQKKCILVNMPNSSLVGHWLFSVKFFDRPTGDKLKLTWRMRWGDMISTLTNDEEVKHKMVSVKVKVGNQWYHGGGSWGTTEPNPYTYGSGEYYWELTNVPQGMPIEVRFYQEYQLGNEYRVQTLSIEDISIEELPILWSDYKYPKTDKDTFKNGNGNGNGENTVSMLFNAYREGSNVITPNSMRTAFTRYQYMMASNMRYQIRFKKNAQLFSWVYLVYMSFMSQQWRVVSISEYPWDDEMAITMQRVIN